MEQPTITLYGRPGCELCDRTEEILRRLIDEAGSRLTLHVVNIEEDPAVHARLLEQIPAVEIAGRLLPIAVSPMQIAAHIRSVVGQGDGER
ncbi:MAG: glutaredoxin family protein [Candidatus Limnocylindrus sp.]|jgi:thioredoxin-like negative regulator of GroEL|nr:glutaredoxin family protein [Candidatus Aquidulcis sp.]